MTTSDWISLAGAVATTSGVLAAIGISTWEARRARDDAKKAELHLAINEIQSALNDFYSLVTTYMIQRNRNVFRQALSSEEPVDTLKSSRVAVRLSSAFVRIRRPDLREAMDEIAGIADDRTTPFDQRVAAAKAIRDRVLGETEQMREADALPPIPTKAIRPRV